MGYTTEFDGAVSVVPPLNNEEITYLKKFSDTRRMNRQRGPYYCGTGMCGQDHEADILDYNRPPDGQPGLWCQWVPSSDGSYIAWDYGEKFYCAAEWMSYLIDHFLREGCEVQKDILRRERIAAPSARDEILAQFDAFTFDHVVNGVIDAQGEDPEDRWRLIVKDNVVSVKTAKIVWED